MQSTIGGGTTSPESGSVPPGISLTASEARRLLSEGNFDGARSLLERERVRCHGAGNRDGEAHALRMLGDVEWLAQEYQKAHDFYTTAQEIIHETADRSAEAELFLTLGDARRKLKRTNARDAYRSATRLYERLDAPLGRAHAEFWLGHLAASSNPGIAKEHFSRAAAFYNEADKRNPSPALRLENPPLPDKVEETHVLEPWLMAKVALREIQKLRDALDRATATVVVAPAKQTARETARRDLIVAGIIFGGPTLVFVGLVFASIATPALYFPVGKIACALIAAVAAASAAIGARVLRLQSRALSVAGPIAVYVAVFSLSFLLLQNQSERRVHALLLGETPSSPAELALALVQLGQNRALHNADEAREAYLQALALYRQLGDRRAEADVLRAQADLELSLNRRVQALGLYTQALEAYRTLDDPGRTVQLVVTIAETQRSMNRLAQAGAGYREAAELYEKLDNPDAQGRMLSRLGDMERRLGRWDAARSAYARALELARQEKDVEAQLAILPRLGRTLAALGKPEEARQYYASALALAEQRHDVAAQGRVWLATARFEDSLTRRGPAREAYDRALALFTQAQAVPEQVRALRGIGDLARDSSNLPAARESYERALSVARASSNRTEEARTLVRLGEIERTLKHTDTARAQYTQALALFHELLDTAGQARAAFALGELEMGAGRPAEAREAYEKALARYEEDGRARGQIKTLRKLSTLIQTSDAQMAKSYASRAATLEKNEKAATAAQVSL